MVEVCNLGAVSFPGGNGNGKEARHRLPSWGMRLKKCGAGDASCAEYAKRRREHTGDDSRSCERGNKFLRAGIKLRRDRITHGLKQTRWHVICYRHSSRITVGPTQTNRITRYLLSDYVTTTGTKQWCQCHGESAIPCQSYGRIDAVYLCCHYSELQRGNGGATVSCNVDWWLSSTTGVTCHGQ